MDHSCWRCTAAVVPHKLPKQQQQVESQQQQQGLKIDFLLPDVYNRRFLKEFMQLASYKSLANFEFFSRDISKVDFFEQNFLIFQI